MSSESTMTYQGTKQNPRTPAPETVSTVLAGGTIIPGTVGRWTASRVDSPAVPEVNPCLPGAWHAAMLGGHPFAHDLGYVGMATFDYSENLSDHGPFLSVLFGRCNSR